MDQATFDIRSGLISKYVNFTFASRRRRGEAILPMHAISSRADNYIRLFTPDRDLALEQIERKRVIGKESIYYELWYSPQPQDVPYFHPLMKLLVDASTGRFYRVEIAPDYLDVGTLPTVIISRAAAARVAGIFLEMTDLAPHLGSGASVRAVLAPELSYVRPNSWLGGLVPKGGTARAAWVVPFQTADGGEKSNLLFIDAAGGRILGGVPAPP